MKMNAITTLDRLYGKGIIATVALLLGLALSSKAQLNPFTSMYFQNRYLYNPAMAGINSGLNINLDYMQQWSEFPGTPKTKAGTADFQVTDKVGFGVNVSSDEAGLIRTTDFKGSYAYHLPLSDRNEKLSFGVSLGFNDTRVNYAAINGNAADPEVALYNRQKPYVDGSFGIAYNNDHLYVGAAIPDLKSAFFKTGNQSYSADRLLFITVASYKIPLQNENRAFELEPLVGFRKVDGYSDIMDFGFNFRMNDYGLHLQTIYHTSQSIGAGIGLDQDTYAVNFSYDFVTGQLSNYTNGTFEIGVKLRLFGKKN